MLRRVARVLRGLLLVLGLAVLLWLPASWYRGIVGSSTDGHSIVLCANGWLQVSLRKHHALPTHARSYPSEVFSLGRAVWPTFDRHSNSYIATLSLPLWLLSALCLAWPVTSFIINRRRHKRGFPVEPKGAGDSLNTSAS